jgi:uncharacterized protein YdeI (BOF family)
MKKSLFRSLLVTALLVAPALSIYAAPPAPYHLTTVSWVLATRDNLDQDDKYVTLIGRVTGRDDGGDYFFTDGTGTVRLDPNDFVLPVGPRIVIGGRIDQAYLGIGHLEVDVRNWHYAKRASAPK